MMTDIIISPGVHWSVYVASGCATMWFTMAVGYVKRFNLLKNAALQLLIMPSQYTSSVGTPSS